MPVLYEQQGGILEPEKMIAAHVKVAQYHGAQVHTGRQGLQSAGRCHQQACCQGRHPVATSPASSSLLRWHLTVTSWLSFLFFFLCINREQVHAECTQSTLGLAQCTARLVCVCVDTCGVCMSLSVCVRVTGEAVQGWTVLPDGLVEVGTDRGTYRAERLVLTAGAWMDQLVPELQLSWAHKCGGRDTRRFCRGWWRGSFSS